MHGPNLEDDTMTSLPDRPNTALLIIDVQRDVVAEAHDRDAVIANINTALTGARNSGTPVIWVQHNDDGLRQGTEGWEYVEELQREPSEPVVHKQFGDSFEETHLEDLLAERTVGHLVVTGAQTDACVRNTLHGALVRGYDATLVSDAHTTDDPSRYGAPLDAAQVIAHTNLYWQYTSAPGRRGNTVTAADLTFPTSV